VVVRKLEFLDVDVWILVDLVKRFWYHCIKLGACAMIRIETARAKVHPTFLNTALVIARDFTSGNGQVCRNSDVITVDVRRKSVGDELVNPCPLGGFLIPVTHYSVGQSLDWYA
jgi:hypothetical protein